MTANGASKWIDEEFIGIETMTLDGAIWTIHAPAVDLARLETSDEDVENVARLVPFRVECERYSWRRRIGGVEEIEICRRRMTRIDGKIDAFVRDGGSEWEGLTLSRRIEIGHVW